MIAVLEVLLTNAGISFTTVPLTTSHFSETTQSVPATTPSFNFSVNVISAEAAKGPDIIQWNIIKDELTTERMAAINNIIQKTITNYNR